MCPVFNLFCSAGSHYPRTDHVLLSIFVFYEKATILMAFPWTGLNFPKDTDTLRGHSLPFTTNSLRVTGTHLIDLGIMKD